MTFSLLARDPLTGALGVASQSHYLGVGPAVTWAEAGIGVVATQAIPQRSYGPRGLALMRRGNSAGEALSMLLDADPNRELRQIAYLDAAGRFAIHSGKRCVAAAGAVSSQHAAAVGNMLDNPAVLDAMLAGFEQAEGDLAHRLILGLRDGELAGGDIRGQQSAALLVVEGRPTDTPWDGVLRDLRVDDHVNPIGELARLLRLNDAYDQVSQVVFDPSGAVLGKHSDTKFAAAAAALAEADKVLDDNPEAVFWSAVLHARWGRAREARRLAADAARRNPRLNRFVQRLTDAGILTREELSRLL